MSSTLDRLRAEIKAAQEKANKANQERYDEALGIIRKQYGKAEGALGLLGERGIREAAESAVRQRGRLQQNLVTSGLANTTIAGSMMRGVESDRLRAVQEAREGQALREAGLATQRAGAEAGLMERRTDLGPDPGLYAQLMQQAAATQPGGKTVTTIIPPNWQEWGDMDRIGSASLGIAGTGRYASGGGGGATYGSMGLTGGGGGGSISGAMGGGGGGGPMGGGWDARTGPPPGFYMPPGTSAESIPTGAEPGAPAGKGTLTITPGAPQAPAQGPGTWTKAKSWDTSGRTRDWINQRLAFGNWRKNPQTGALEKRRAGATPPTISSISGGTSPGGTSSGWESGLLF